MPSSTHEALIEVLRESPRLVPMLVAQALGKELDPGLADGAGDADIQVTSAEFGELDAPEYRADLVLRVPGEGGGKRATREAFIVEVQLAVDPVKHFTWPYYVTSARVRFRCRATLVVVTVDERVARWCAQPIELDLAGNVFRPVVLGPSAIPVITDESLARTWPELAVLSVIAHGHEPGSQDIALAAVAGCAPLDSTRSNRYADIIYSSLSETARAALEDLLQQKNYTYQSDFARKYVAEGRKEGILEGYREMLHTLLEQRFGALPTDAVARIDKADSDTLSAWGRRVLTANSLDDVFTTDSK
jgi:hypothetical protein